MNTNCIIELKEHVNKLYKQPVYTLDKDKKFLCLGNYANVLQFHKRLKNVLMYGYINNKDSDIILSHNDDTFFIKNKKHNTLISLPNEQVRYLSANIGKFIYSKMNENKS